MHEFSLVRSLLKQVDEIVIANGGRSAVDVRVEIGPLSGVEPLLVREAFTQLTSDTCHDPTTLTIDELSLTAHCGACKADFEVPDFCFVCPRCGSGDTHITGGDQFRLLSVTVDAPEESVAVDALCDGAAALRSISS